ncbi:MAG: FAD:protein FMN transferase [Armatimonadetes bacterium]|nr:FAD:protein FMN transferase [Armatimonadota bacterium]
MYRFARRCMACEFELCIDAPSRQSAMEMAEEVWELIASFEKQISYFRPDSDIAFINAMAAKEPVQLEPGLFGLIDRCVELSRQTKGAFDITATPLLRIWGILDRAPRLPSEEEIHQTLEMVGSDLILLNSEGRWLYFARPGIEISLGAIGKGEAVDRAMARLKELGAGSALVNAGGSSMAAFGIGQPVSIDGKEVELKDQSLAVSGAAEATFVLNGEQFCHLVDPRTGRALAPMPNVCVVGDSAADAEAWSTAIAVDPGLSDAASQAGYALCGKMGAQ